MRTFFFGGLVSSFLLFLGVMACGKPSDCASCPGCCNASGQCVSGTSTLECGAGGLSCSACGTTQNCVAGACVSQGAGGGGGATGGGGGSTGIVYLSKPDGGLAVSAASGDTCAGMTQLVAEYVEQLGECPDEGSGVGPLTEERCRSRLPSCTAPDREQIDVLLNCFRRIPPCTAATRFNTWRDRKRVCEMLAQGIAKPCQDALSH